MLAGELVVKYGKTLFGDDIYADMLPEGAATRPAAVYQYISSAAENTLDCGHTGTDAVRIQVDVYAPVFEDADEFSRLLIPLLTQQPELVCLYLGRRNLSEPETRQARFSMDFSIWETM